VRRIVLVSFLLALAACGPDLATRYETGNRALSNGEGAMYFVVISAHLQQILNRCIPPGTKGASPMLVLVADIGAPSRLELEPDSAGTDCVRQDLTEKPWPKPPLAPGAATFPIGLRIDTK
jgi:hypothetical protein